MKAHNSNSDHEIEATKVKNLLSSPLFARNSRFQTSSSSVSSMTSTSSSKAPTRQNTFGGNPNSSGVGTPTKPQKSRSLVDMTRSQSMEVHPSALIDGARASPSRLQSQKLMPVLGPDEQPSPAGDAKPAAPPAGPASPGRDVELKPPDGLVELEGTTIKSGTVPRIVEQFALWFKGPSTPQAVLDQRDGFLMCYKTYCSPSRLLDILQTLYMATRPPNIPEDDWKRYLAALHPGLADFVRRWLSLSYQHDFWNEDGTVNYLAYEKLMDLLVLVSQDKMAPSKLLKDMTSKAHTPESRGEKKKLKERKSVRKSFNELIISKKLPRPEEINLGDLHVSDIAEHLTFIDHELFSRITRNEVLSFSSTKANSAIRSLQHRGDLLRRWAATEILGCVNAKQRSVVVERFARIAEVHALPTYISSLSSAHSIRPEMPRVRQLPEQHGAAGRHRTPVGAAADGQPQEDAERDLPEPAASDEEALPAAAGRVAAGRPVRHPVAGLLHQADRGAVQGAAERPRPAGAHPLRPHRQPRPHPVRNQPLPGPAVQQGGGRVAQRQGDQDVPDEPRRAGQAGQGDRRHVAPGGVADAAALVVRPRRSFPFIYVAFPLDSSVNSQASRLFYNRAAPTE